MTLRTVLQSVPVLRDGKRVVPPIGKAFDFTEEEIEHFNKHAPGALGRAVVQDDDDDDLPAPPAAEQTGIVVKKTAEPKAPKAPKAAKAPKSKKTTTEEEIEGL